MPLSQSKILFVDCQTTGMRPSVGQILELAWVVHSAAPLAKEDIQSALVRLPAGAEIPAVVTQLTGLGAEHMGAAEEAADVFAKFRAAADFESAVIHYAQFEKPFLLDLFQRYAGAERLPFPVICSQQLSKRLFPNLPSHNIRGAAGFFGANIGGIKRASSHVLATHQIWQGLSKELETRGVDTLAALETWLAETPKVKATRYEYRLDKLKRLELPDKPGIYRMLSKSGEVLYVGKATSLKSRVNSYFRGKKGRDQRKLEMLAQVWDLRVTDCETPLEAALLETDEIKRHNPPYNVVFKRGRRHLVFYNRDFTSARAVPSPEFALGPFRNHNWMEHLRALFGSLGQPTFDPRIFFDPLPPADLRAGFELFCETHALPAEKIKSARSLLARGMWLLKNFTEPLAAETEEEEAEEEAPEHAEAAADTPPSREEIAAKYERLFRRAAAEYRRARKLTGLLNSDIVLQTKVGPRQLSFRRGTIARSADPVRTKSWDGLAIDDYDRMSILLSELTKYTHKVERLK